MAVLNRRRVLSPSNKSLIRWRFAFTRCEPISTLYGMTFGRSESSRYSVGQELCPPLPCFIMNCLKTIRPFTGGTVKTYIIVNKSHLKNINVTIKILGYNQSFVSFDGQRELI